MPQTLLLADDSATIQRVIELTFADEDIQVVAVSDGDQAIARLDSAPPDIVLADVGMPGKTGYEVAEYVKQSPKLSHIPVVLLTGAFEPVDQEKAAAVGCDGVLAKPFEPQLVIGRVRELLGRPGQAPASPRPEPVPVLAAFEPAAAAPAASRVEDYFDRIDAAFSQFSTPAAPQVDVLPMAPAASAATEFVIEPTSFAAAAELAAVAPPTPEPPALVSPEPPVEEQTVPEPPPAAQPIAASKALESVEPVEPVKPAVPLESSERVEAPRVVALPSTPRAVPSIPDAFSAILSAEQNATGVRPEWPSASAAPEITDEVIERIARRVLDQMSDRVVRETVAEIVSSVTERLVREEIERIKAAIK